MDAAELIECLEELGLNQGGNSMRSDFTDYFAEQVRGFPADTVLGKDLEEFCLQATRLFGPFPKDNDFGDPEVVRLRLIDHLDGLANTFRSLSPTSDGRTPSNSASEQSKGNGGMGSTPRKSRSTKTADITPQRGRPVDKSTIRRAAFAKPLRDNGVTWQEIAVRYQKKHPKDVDASADTIRLAFDRQYAKQK